MLRSSAALAGALLLAMPGAFSAAADTLRLATTISTENSGLLRDLVPKFEAASGLKVQVISVGTMRALALGENGEVDVVLVHSRTEEDRFVASGHGVNRRDVMRSDFVIVGPRADPAGLRGGHDVIAALRRVVDSKATFISRGDDSSTDKMERGYWKQVGRQPDESRYLPAGLGMTSVLTATSQIGAYTLTDRGTYAAYRSRVALDVLVEGDPRLFNPYGVIAVNRARHPGVNYDGAMKFVDWITGGEGRRAIAEYRVGGEQLFFPAAR